VKFLKFEHSSVYPVNPWQITEENFPLKSNHFSETIFTLGNGYIGIRGSFEEGLARNTVRSTDGIYLNGFYESVPIPHAERGYGYAQNSQTMLNVTDSKIIDLYLEDERFYLESGTVLKYKRTLDLKEGCQVREVIWRSEQGKEVLITVKRLVPFMHRHLMAFHYQVEPLNFSGKVTIKSSLDGDVDNHTHEEYDPRFSASLGDLCLSISEIIPGDTGAVMIQETRRSGLSLACAMENHLEGGNPDSVDTGQGDNKVSVSFKLEGQKNKKITLTKFVSYYTSRDYAEEELPELAKAMVEKGKTIGFQALLEEQKEYMNQYWDTIGFEIEGDESAEQGLRFSMFHLLQSAGDDGRTSVPAKGLTSEGYDGHYFWDTEIYMIPFFVSIKPERARKLLEYRYSILDHARSRARELSHERGALYPWRTIAGEEGSSYYPASTAQYHINAAIAYAISSYVQMTDDFSFLIDYGAEIIFETARLWEDLGTYVPKRGNRFCFHEVTGPDEYTALVNNNCYTNLMAQWHLRYAYETVLLLEQGYPEEYKRIADKIELQKDEWQAWRLASEYMYIPYDETMQIHPQDDGFMEKEVWDFSATPISKYPLLLHYHPLVIYRFQVCKQPDVILAHFLLADRFNLEQKRRDYDYYETITTHDSSLSPCIFSIISSELGYVKDAYRFFTISSRLDLDNLMKSTHYGLHMANMAGSWLCLINGFGGMRIKGGDLCFDPYLPAALQRYRFRIFFKGNLLEISVMEKSVTYRLLEGDSICFFHRGEMVTLSGGGNVNFVLPDLEQ
jgi:trehalose/maltose hydrolase-like predicted phosphorylase